MQVLTTRTKCNSQRRGGSGQNNGNTASYGCTGLRVWIKILSFNIRGDLTAALEWGKVRRCEFTQAWLTKIELVYNDSQGRHFVTISRSRTAPAIIFDFPLDNKTTFSLKQSTCLVYDEGVIFIAGFGFVTTFCKYRHFSLSISRYVCVTAVKEKNLSWGRETEPFNTRTSSHGKSVDWNYHSYPNVASWLMIKNSKYRG